MEGFCYGCRSSIEVVSDDGECYCPLCGSTDVTEDEGRVQTRNAEGELRFWPTVLRAFEHAKQDATVWKVSFWFRGERIRLVRVDLPDENVAWVYEPLSGVIDEHLKVSMEKAELPEPLRSMSQLAMDDLSEEEHRRFMAALGET